MTDVTAAARGRAGRVPALLDRHARWILPASIALLAAVLRMVNLAHPHQLVFDETYYVKDAWTLLNLGYESNWPDDPDSAFLTGDTNQFSTDASFVVHPPLGKWVIALGLALFGADNGWGWRFGTALFGVLIVPLVFLIAKRLTRSTVWASIAAGLIAIDPLSIAMSRVALLDGILAFFVALGFYFLVKDWDDTRSRVVNQDTGVWGRVIWTRPWVMAAGIAFGAAASVKWSGLYALAGAGIGLVVMDALWRRRAGIREWYLASVLRQGPVTFVLLVPTALVTYLLSWSGWLVTTGGYDRGSDANPFVALWNYHRAMYGFHIGLSSDHTYASPAWQWPFLIRPTAMWVHRPEIGAESCWWSDDCMGVITSIPNPIVWWASWLAVLGLIWLLIRSKRAIFAFPLIGLAVTYVPWLLYPERTIFHFYTVVMQPFLLIGLVLVLQAIAKQRTPHLLPDPTADEIAQATETANTQTQAWRFAVGGFLVIALLVGIFFLPFAIGIVEPYPIWQAHNWLQSWI